MPNIRMSRIDAEIQKAVASIIDKKLNHPALTGKLVTVLKVDTTPDLILSTLFVSVLGEGEDQAIKVLNESKGFIRKELSKVIRLKTLPDLKFVKDTSYDYNKHMDELFDSIKGDNNEVDN